MAQFQTNGYPTPTTFAAWNDGSDNLRVSISGMLGRRFAVAAGAVIDSTGFYDNVVVRALSGYDGTPSIYLNAGTTGSDAVVGGVALLGNVQLAIGGGESWSDQTGFFNLVLMVETGTATGVYVPLAESGLEYDVVITGAPGFAEVGGATPAPACFWENLVRVSQDCVSGPVVTRARR